MTRVEVLAPLRIETRFVAEEAGDWTMHVRVYPDDFSLARPPAPPTEQELDILADALAAIAPDAADQDAAVDAAFRSAAAALGGRRAWWLWRTATAEEPGPDGVTRRTVDRNGAAPPEVTPGKPLGLPDALDVWLVLNDGVRLAATLTLSPDDILADLEVEALRPLDRRLARLWWLDYERAVEVGLATAIPLAAAEVDALQTLIVVGAGQAPAAELLQAHAAAGRLAVIAQGTPTNTVAGRAAAPLADDAETWLRLLDGAATDQPATRSLFVAFGSDAAAVAAAPPVPGGERQHGAVAQLAVHGLWPALWGRAIRDIAGTLPGSTTEPDLASWASETLAVQGPLPAIRIGDQPYGLVPTSDFGVADRPGPGDLDVRWLDDPDDDPDRAGIERSIVPWAVVWRDGAASAAAGSTTVKDASPVVGADSATLLGLHGRHAPSAFWRVRRVGDLPAVQARQIADGLPVSHATSFDRALANAAHGTAFSFDPLTADGARRHLPPPPQDEEVDLALLEEMLFEEPESLYYRWEDRPLGLFGHLLRESLIIARATIGRAWLDYDAGMPVDPSRRIPLDDDYPNVVMAGSDQNLQEVAGADPGGERLLLRFEEHREGLRRLIEAYGQDPGSTLRSIKAALDTASLRVDPWLLGVASRRLGRFASAGAPFLLGAYGWVDSPRPWLPGRPGLPPGPTEAGLIHAPSHAQAQVAAILRDAALHNADDGRWDIALTSDRVRAAVALGERVRLGVHPFEALGLEVEAVAGDPDVVRTLRRTFPTTAETASPDETTRRVCDGVAVLHAAREGLLPAGLPADLATRLAPLEEVLDTYADLLLVDGVHALVTRTPEAGGAAMEAAAGLSTPPELRGIRTPREATTVPVSCWVVLPPGTGAPGADPAAVADPAFAALVGGAVDDPADPALAAASRLVGGTEAAADSMADHPDLVPAMVGSLKQRRTLLLERVAEAIATLRDAEEDVTSADLELLDTHWRLDLHEQGEDWTLEDQRDEAARALEARREGAGGDPPAALSALQAQLRALVGRPHLPVVPVVARTELPPWALVPDGRLDADWLEVAAAVHPRIAPLEAHQLTSAAPWPSAIDAPGADPWATQGPVHIAYGPGLAEAGTHVALALLDRWVDSVPSRHHVTQAAFGFNAPKTRAPNAVLLAVPPDPARPLEGEALLEVVRQARMLAIARAARPTDRVGLPWATPTPIVQAELPVDIRRGWPV